MAIMDARGRVRPGVFEVVYDRRTDTSYTPLSGEGDRITFRATGPRVHGDGIVEARRWFSPDDLTAAAERQGVITPPVMHELIQLDVMPLTKPPRRGKRTK